MDRINRYCHVIGAQQGLQCHQDLLSQTLLHLWALGEKLHDTVDFRQADHRIFRNVGHGGFTVDCHEMVFTGAGQGNVAHRHHFIYLHLVFDDGNFWEIRVVQAGENFIDIHLGNAMRGFRQAIVG
ncbi:hypothetical protein D3C73_1170950 [compost metagenome]